MKKLAILLATALLGISSAAIAKPAAGSTQVADNDHDHNYDRDRDRFDHDRGDRGDRGDYRPAYTQWLDLGVARTGKTTIRVGDRTRFRSLKLDVNGWLRVNQVLVRFSNGTQRLVKLQHTDMSRRDPLVIDLGSPRRIDSVIVYAARYGRGSVEVSGLSTPYFDNRG